MKKIRIVVGGIYGRMGCRVAALAESSRDFILTGGLVRHAPQALQACQASGLVREPLDQKSGQALIIGLKAAELMEQADVLVEFTSPEAALKHLGEICGIGKAAVVGVTGLSDNQRRQLALIAKKMPIVYDANFSLGIALIRQAIATAASGLGDDFDCGMLEIHRKGKKDAPSGTAIHLADLLMKAVGEKPLVHSLRLGEVPGEHTVYLANSHEVVELSHRVYSRDAFAAGALYAARWVKGRGPGLFSFTDVLKK
ncbi:MAG: 4-hydroxy-tetrahydrodipicolinate reductase [Elusimicrobia bacterium]|nr:4-hydroxy-tetrahydrodipicolinate reductase [Elusimicrobiota bacterium]